MAYDDDFDEDGNAQPMRRKIPQTNPFFFLLIGIVIGFVVSMFFAPSSFSLFGSPSQFNGKITAVDKFVSQDLRTNKVLLRINDSNIAVCSDGDNCLAYEIGDTVQVTCFGKECQAVKE
jgi:hypothetical protein